MITCYTSHKLLVTVRVFTDNSTYAVVFIKTIGVGAYLRDNTVIITVTT